MPAWQFAIYQGLEDIEQAFPREKWESIFWGAESATMSHHPDMVLNWYRSFGKLWQRDPLLIVANSNNRQVFYPFEIVREKWKGLTTRILTPIGGAFHFDFQDPLVSGVSWDKDEVESFWRGLSAYIRQAVRDCDRVVLYRLRSEFVTDMAQNMESTVCPYIDLAGKKTLDDVLANCHGSHRGDVKRQMRKLAVRGDLSLRRFDPGELPVAEDALRCFFLAYDEQWAPKGPHAYETPVGRSFLEGVLRDLLPTGLLHFSVLYCGDTPIHWHLGFVFRGRFYFYKLAGDRQWSNFSPGKVHTALLIEYCLHNDIRYFDFLYGDESYKFTWTSQTYPLYRQQWWNGLHPVKRTIEDFIRPGYRALKNGLPCKK